MSFSIVMQRRNRLQELLWSIAAATALCCAQDTAAAHLGRGYELIQDQRYGEAAREFQRALALDPKLPRARYQLAVSLFALGRREESEEEFERLRRESPGNRAALYYLGRLRLLAGDDAGALRFLQPISADPPIPDTLFYAGCALLDKGDLPHAIEALEKAELQSPRDYRVPYRLARAYSRVGRTADAAREYGRSAALRAEYNAAAADALQCGEALDKGEAQTPCGRLLDPNDPDKLTTLGIIYGEHGAFEQAIAPLQLAAKLDPDSFEIFHNLGLSYFRLRRFQEARPALERAVALRPDFFGSNALLGAVLFTLKDDSAAYGVLSHAHDLEPGNGDVSELLFKVAMVLAGSRFEAKDYAGSLEYLRTAEHVTPSNATVHRRLAEIYDVLGNPAAASEQRALAEGIESRR